MYGVIPPLPLYVFMTWCLLKRMDFTFHHNVLIQPSIYLLNITKSPSRLVLQHSNPIMGYAGVNCSHVPHFTEVFGSIDSGEFADQLSDYKFLSKQSMHNNSMCYIPPCTQKHQSALAVRVEHRAGIGRVPTADVEGISCLSLAAS